jgi:hypothetical protein
MCAKCLKLEALPRHQPRSEAWTLARAVGQTDKSDVDSLDKLSPRVAGSQRGLQRPWQVLPSHRSDP